MPKYYIYPDNIEKVTKKLESIRKKCEKYDANFIFNDLGEEIQDVRDEDGSVVKTKMHVFEVEGFLKHNDWSFVATLDHHEGGNVIRRMNTELEIPEKYKTCGPYCDHCKKIRSRKDTYLIYNEVTQEFKQVGRSCLKEFTQGLDAEAVAFMGQFLDTMEKYDGVGSTSGSIRKYFEVKEVLNYAFETFRHFGYEKRDPDFDGPQETTRDRVVEYMYLSTPKRKEEIEYYGLDFHSDYAVETTEKALEWLKEQDDSSEYIRSLKLICSEDYMEWRDFGIAVSLTIAYDRATKKAEQEAKRVEKESVSEYQGEVGQRITFEPTSVTLTYTMENMYGMTYLYKIEDASGNIYIWYASKWIEDPESVKSITGTIKEHSEYRGTKQTVLTRCKVQ